MIAAYVLIQTGVGQAAVVAAAARGVPGVSEAESVAGPYDVIVRAQARNIDELGRLVVSRIHALGGVSRTITCPIISVSAAGSRRAPRTGAGSAPPPGRRTSGTRIDARVDPGRRLWPMRRSRISRCG
jgi:hypothetical protein